jgi:hypothetical protein
MDVNSGATVETRKNPPNQPDVKYDSEDDFELKEKDLDTTVKLATMPTRSTKNDIKEEFITRKTEHHNRGECNVLKIKLDVYQ